MLDLIHRTSVHSNSLLYFDGSMLVINTGVISFSYVHIVFLSSSVQQMDEFTEIAESTGITVWSPDSNVLQSNLVSAYVSQFP